MIMIVSVIIIMLIISLVFLLWPIPKARPESCKALINIVISQPVSKEPDSVDGQPEQQWDLFTRPELNPKNYFKDTSGEKISNPMLRYAFSDYAHPMLSKLLDCEKAKLRWVFVRGYSADPKSRTSLLAHRDATTFTINIILSEPTEYEGGEFLRLGSAESEVHKGSSNLWITNHIETKFQNGEIYGEKPPAGTAIVLKGDRNGGGEIHGVRPITNGERYVLCAFFEGDFPSLLHRRSLKKGIFTF